MDREIVQHTGNRFFYSMALPQGSRTHQPGTAGNGTIEAEMRRLHAAEQPSAAGKERSGGVRFITDAPAAAAKAATSDT